MIKFILKLSIISFITLVTINSQANQNCDLSQFENPLENIEKIDLTKIVGYEKAIAPHHSETRIDGTAVHDLRVLLKQTTLDEIGRAHV